MSYYGATIRFYRGFALVTTSLGRISIYAPWDTDRVYRYHTASSLHRARRCIDAQLTKE